VKTNRIYLFISIALLFASACNKPEKEYMAPKVHIQNPFGITNTKATMRASFTEGSEDITVFGFEWKEITEDNWETISTQVNNGTYSFTITNLKEKVEYAVRAFIIDASDNRVVSKEKRFLTNGTLTDIDGNTYYTLRYGSKTWMTENLRTTRYADGTPIEGRSGGVNLDSDGPVYFHGGYHTSYLREPNFGLLYNWAAAMRADDCETNIGTLPSFLKGACPDGWHLPTINEWAELIDHFGGSEEAGTIVKTNNWAEPAYLSFNSSRFSVEPAGWYYYEPGQGFRNLFSSAYFWSSTQNTLSGGFSAFAVAIVSENSGFYSIKMAKKTGYSVRCVRDHQDW